MGGIETLLLNVLFLIVFLLFVPLFLAKSLRVGSKKLKKSLLFMSVCIAIISCISFPITVFEGFIFDLRWVPLIVGTLYGGIPISIALFTSTVIFRYIIGGEGVFPNLIVCTIIVLLSILLIKNFQESSRMKKIMIGSSLSLLAGMLQFFIFSSLYNLPLTSFYMLSYSGILLFASFIVIYSLEVMREDQLINIKLIRAEKMEIVSHLASSISHEVRNPLTVVRGFLQMMEQAELSDFERKKFLRLSIEEIDRANHIIGDYLAFAKPSHNHTEILDIKNETQRAIDIIKPLANMNSVEVITNIQSFYIEGDPQMLQQCLLNLTKNSIEAMPDSGKLLIDIKKENSNVIIEIEDNGKGMTEDQLARIGEPYFTTKGHEGNGLGMMTVMRIIKLMDGEFKITSEVNKGTKCKISFPTVDKKQSEPA